MEQMHKLVQLGFTVIVSFVVSSEISAESHRKPSTSNLAPGEIPIGTTVRCESDAITGFNWRNGKWNKVNFINSTYIFKKLDHKSDDRSVARCTLLISSKTDMVEDRFLSLNRCYSVQELGGGKPTVEVCSEFHFDGETNSVVCGSHNEYAFHPYEQLLIAPHHRNVKSNPKDDYKDSFVVGVGKCAQM
jgi:hypothetical protein